VIIVTPRRDSGLAQAACFWLRRGWMRRSARLRTSGARAESYSATLARQATARARTDSPKQPVRSTDSRRVRCRASPSSDRWRSSRDRRRACGRRKFRRCWHGGPPTLRSACAVPRVVWQMDAQADEASVLGLAVCLYESSVSWTFARRVERVKGFCRNMVASSSTP